LRIELCDHLPVIDGGVRDDHLWGLCEKLDIPVPSERCL
jgi:hypothetical protein